MILQGALQLFFPRCGSHKDERYGSVPGTVITAPSTRKEMYIKFFGQVCCDNNFEFLKKFLRSFTLEFPTSKEMEARKIELVSIHNHATSFDIMSHSTLATYRISLGFASFGLALNELTCIHTECQPKK